MACNNVWDIVRILLTILWAHTHTHKEPKLILLVLIDGIKLCMDEALEEGDNYFLMLIWNNIDDNNAEIMCMSHSEITYIRKNFMG